MTRARRALVAALAGAACGAAPPFAASRGNLDALAVLSAPFAATDAPDVALVVLDADTARHAAFASLARAEWSAPLAAVVERVLDAGATVVGIDVVLTRADRIAPAWLQVLRRGAREGRVVLAAAPGDPPAWPTAAQRTAAGGALASAALLPDGDRTVRTVSAADGALPTLAAALAARTGVRPAAPVPVAVALPAIPLHSASAVLDQRDPAALRDAFAGRAVLVGGWFEHEDHHAAVVPGAGRSVPGLLLHAIAVHQWQRQVQAPPTRRVDIATALVGAALGAALPALVAAGVVLACAALAAWAYAVGVTLPAAAATVALVAASLVSAALRRADAAARFAAALPVSFRNRPDAPVLRSVTACFVDIESFTAAGESQPPLAIAADLDACLRRLAATVERHGGFVDKCLGDGLLALFGVDGRDARADAVAAARALHRAVAGAKLGGHPVRLRIGLATGDARLGPLGHAIRIHITAIGDCVNVAARLEQLNRVLGTRTLADERTAAACPHHPMRDHGLHRLRGRSQPVRVFELNIHPAPV